jgi:anti-anti-sigma factor
MEDGEAVGGLSIVAVERDGSTAIVVAGELDSFTADNVRNAIAAIVDGDVLLDLDGIRFIDSSGLASIIESHLYLIERERRLVVGPRSPVVQRLLDLTGVQEALDGSA